MVMPRGEYEVFEALNPFFEVVMEGLRGLVDGDHYFDTIAEDASFEFRYHFPGWPLSIRGRANLMTSYSGYGKTIKLHSGASELTGITYTNGSTTLGTPARCELVPIFWPSGTRSDSKPDWTTLMIHLVGDKSK